MAKSIRPATRRVLAVGALAALVGACSLSAPSPYLAGAGSSLGAEKHELPAFSDPELKAYRASFEADRREWDLNPAGFFPPVEGDSPGCDLSAGRAEELVLGMPREKFLKIASGQGMKLRITSLQWRVVKGACPDGALSGPVEFRADYTLRGSGPPPTNVETTSSSQIHTRGDFVNGMPSGKQSRHRLDTTTIVVNGGSSTQDVTRTFEYEEVAGKELRGKSLTVRLMPNLDIVQTVIKESIEPGVARSEVYQGPRKSAVFHSQDGVTHGEFVSIQDGKEFRSCYSAGALVGVEACEGGHRVNLEHAAPANGALQAGATAASSPAPAAPAPGGKSAGAVPNPPAQGASNAWPDLASSMTRVGGGELDAAVIVGVENYAFVAPVPGASRNAKDWYRYFTRVRGLRAGNVRLLLDNDATDVGLRGAIEESAKLVGAGGSLWFVFIGHGAPSADQLDGLLVGVDAQQTAQGLYARSVPQKELIRLASAGQQQRTVFVIDACFSGRSGSGAALASGLQPLIPVKAGPAHERTLTFTAGRSDQFAGPLPRLDRPAFSYLMLGGLLGWSDTNRDGTISTLELVDYSSETLRAVLNGRNQTPELFPRSDHPLAKSPGVAGPDVAEIALGD